MLSIYTLVVLKRSHLSVPYKDQKCVILHLHQLNIKIFNDTILSEIKAPQNICALQYTDSESDFETINKMDIKLICACRVQTKKEYLHYLVPRATTLIHSDIMSVEDTGNYNAVKTAILRWTRRHTINAGQLQRKPQRLLLRL